MKKTRFYAILFSLIIIGIQSVNLYRNQQEARILEFEGYEITTIEARVDDLYNEEKTDIKENISEEELAELDEMFLDLDEKDLTKQNRRRINDAHLDFLMAQEMHSIQKDVRSLYETGNIVAETVSLKEVEAVEEEVEAYKIKPVYYERNIALIKEAKEQLSTIEAATKTVEHYFDDEGNVLEDIMEADAAENLEMIEEIKNTAVKNKLLSRMDHVRTVLEDRAEALALEEELEELETLEEEEEINSEEAATPTVENTAPSNAGGRTNTSQLNNSPRTNSSDNETTTNESNEAKDGASENNEHSEEVDNEKPDPQYENKEKPNEEPVDPENSDSSDTDEEPGSSNEDLETPHN